MRSVLRSWSELTWTWAHLPLVPRAGTWPMVPMVADDSHQVQWVVREPLGRPHSGTAHEGVERESHRWQAHMAHALWAEASHGAEVVSVAAISRGMSLWSHIDPAFSTCPLPRIVGLRSCLDERVATSDGMTRPKLCQTLLRQGTLPYLCAVGRVSEVGASHQLHADRSFHCERVESGSAGGSHGSHREVVSGVALVVVGYSRGEVGWVVVSMNDNDTKDIQTNLAALW